MNTGNYVSAANEKLRETGFAPLAVPPDLAGRIPSAMVRREEWGLLALALVDFGAAGDVAGRQSLLSAISAWSRELKLRQGTACYFVLLFPFDRRVGDDESAAIRALRQEAADRSWGVIPWVADLAVELVDRHSGFPRVGNEVTLAVTDVPRGKAEEALRQMTGPQIGRRPALALDLTWVPATRTILAATVAYYLLVLLLGREGFAILSGPSPQALVRWGANETQAVFAGQQWRLLTHLFLHGGLLHIGLNMWALWQVGRHVELIYGSFRMGYIYVFAGVAGGFASVALRPGMVNSVGASGAILGLMGALVYFALTAPGRPVDWRSLIGPVGINLAFGFFVGGIDNYAHIGGFVGGLLAAFLVGIPGQRTVWRRVAMGIIGVFVVLLLTGLIPLPRML